MHKKIVFLDRDGVINMKREDYVKNIDEFVFLPNIFEGIKKINSLGFEIIVLTNQSAINRQIITEFKLREIHEHMLKIFNKNSCKILKIFYCPHKPEENCQCRKPKTGMIEQALKEFDINLSKSILIGDSNSDINAAKSAGINSIKLKSNGNLMDIFDNIKEIVKKGRKT